MSVDPFYVKSFARFHPIISCFAGTRRAACEASKVMLLELHIKDLVILKNDNE